MGLTDEQVAKLQALVANGIRTEAHQLDVIGKCFSALRVHDWLNFPGSEMLLQQTHATMSHMQFQKFLFWSNANEEVIDHLHFVNTAPNGAEDQLLFTFAEE